MEKLGWLLERGRGKVRAGRQIQAEQLQATEGGVVLQTGTVLHHGETVSVMHVQVVSEVARWCTV